MKERWYKVGGFLLISLAVILPISFILFNAYTLFTSGSNLGAFLIVIFLFSIVLRSLLFFIFTFFPGKLLLRVGNGEVAETSLTKTSLIFVFISIIFLIPSISAFVICVTEGCDHGAGFETILFISFFLFFYGIAVLLLIINWFKNRNQSNPQIIP